MLAIYVAIYICEDSVEDELHFLFHCDCYHDLDEHKENSFKDLFNIEKWHFISNTMHACMHACDDSQASYIYQ